MDNVLTFIIPVCHQDAVANWFENKRYLAETIRSIAAQDNDAWKAVIVANSGADLPTLPPHVQVKWVDFPFKPLPDKATTNQEVFWNAVRMDKGRRVLAGMLHAGQMGHVMVVDDDDFVSGKLTSFVAQNPTANGWYIKNGYVWGSGGNLLYLYSDFSMFCGTSHIVRADLYQLPEALEAADDEYIRLLMGAHRFTRDHFDKAGTPLAVLPFVGAVYRLGHRGAASQSRGMISHFFMHRRLLKRPKELIGQLSRLRLLTTEGRREFFGD